MNQNKIPKLSLNGAAREMYGNRTYTEVFQQVMYDLERVYPYFADLNARHQRNANFYANWQWNNQELYAHARQFRIPYVWNYIGSQINNILGTQLQTKLDVRGIPIEPGDEGLSTMVNKLLKWSEQINDIDRLESQVFKSGLLGGMGVTQVRWDFSEFIGGYPVYERIPSYQYGWDLNSAEIDRSDARFEFRIMPLTRMEAMELMPEFAEAIDAAEREYSHAYYIIRNAYTPLQNSYADTLGFNTRARDLIYAIFHYEKIRQYRYVICDLIGGTSPIEFDDKKEAQRYLDGITQAYVEGGKPMMDEYGLDNVFMAELKRDCYIQSIVIGNECVSCELTELPASPFQRFYANHYEGDVWSYADGLVSPQRFINRMVSEWDLQIGRANKQFATVIPNKLDGWDFNDFVSARSQTGATAPVKSHDAVQFHDNQPAHPDIIKTLTMGKGFLMEMAGGANALGLQENAAESSKAVKARQAAAGLTKMPMYDNLTRWRMQVAEMGLWYMKNYLDDNQIIRILGDDAQAEFVQLDRNMLNTIKESRTDIQIQSTIDSDIARQETLEQLKEFFQAMQGNIPGQVVLPIMLELSDGIPKDVKTKLLSQIESYQQWQQQQQEQAMQAELMQRAQNQVTTEYQRDAMRMQLQNQQPGDPVIQRMQ